MSWVQVDRSLNTGGVGHFVPQGNEGHLYETAGETISVAIVEGDHRLREGLKVLIDGTPGYRCPRGYGSAEEALRLLGHEPVDVLLLDIHLPGMLGSEAVKVFRAKFPAMQILMLTVYAGPDKVFESICDGASGYLLKKTPPAKLLDAIRETHEGGAPMSPEVARHVISRFHGVRSPRRADYDLTPHETRVLKLFVKGHSYKTAAKELGVTVNTVSFHLRSIYDKLQVHSKTAAVTKALEHHLV